jgi:hypothetical protein
VAQAGDPAEQDGVRFTCQGADPFWVGVPTNRVRGRYHATAGGHWISGAAPRENGPPTGFEAAEDNLPRRLSLRWRTFVSGPAEVEITDYDAAAGTARYRYRGRRPDAALDAPAVDTSGACTAQATTAQRRESFEGIARRVDCRVDFFVEEEGQPRGETTGTGDYVFMFLRREPGETGQGRLLYILSLGDGRSWMERADVRVQTGDAWPAFSASVDFPWGWANFRSDPANQGRILYRSESPLHHAVASNVAEGPCTLVPQAGSYRP